MRGTLGCVAAALPPLGSWLFGPVRTAALTIGLAALLSGCRWWCADCGEGCGTRITRDLEPVTVHEGERATFTVAATSECSLTYQWTRDERGIADADGPSYTTPPTTLQDDGAMFGVDLMPNGWGGQPSSRRVRLTVLAANPASAPAR